MRPVRCAFPPAPTQWRWPKRAEAVGRFERRVELFDQIRLGLSRRVPTQKGTPPRIPDMRAMTADVQVWALNRCGRLRVNSSENGAGIDA